MLKLGETINQRDLNLIDFYLSHPKRHGIDQELNKKRKPMSKLNIQMRAREPKVTPAKRLGKLEFFLPFFGEKLENIATEINKKGLEKEKKANDEIRRTVANNIYRLLKGKKYYDYSDEGCRCDVCTATQDERLAAIYHFNLRFLLEPERQRVENMTTERKNILAKSEHDIQAIINHRVQKDPEYSDMFESGRFLRFFKTLNFLFSKASNDILVSVLEMLPEKEVSIYYETFCSFLFAGKFKVRGNLICEDVMERAIPVVLKMIETSSGCSTERIKKLLALDEPIINWIYSKNFKSLVSSLNISQKNVGRFNKIRDDKTLGSGVEKIKTFIQFKEGKFKEGKNATVDNKEKKESAFDKKFIRMCELRSMF